VALTTSVVTFGNTDTVVYTNTSSSTVTPEINLMFGVGVVWAVYSSGVPGQIFILTPVNPSNVPTVAPGSELHMISTNGYAMVSISFAS
jgi:hypothetical protein